MFLLPYHATKVHLLCNRKRSNSKNLTSSFHYIKISISSYAYSVHFTYFFRFRILLIDHLVLHLDGKVRLCHSHHLFFQQLRKPTDGEGYRIEEECHRNQDKITKTFYDAICFMCRLYFQISVADILPNQRPLSIVSAVVE